MTNLLQITAKHYYKLRQLYYKLRQCVITNYGKMLLQITAALLQITTMCYYKLRQLYQIITNYGSSWFCYKLRQLIITNYGRYYNLRRYYKLRRRNSTTLREFVSKEPLVDFT